MTTKELAELLKNYTSYDILTVISQRNDAILEWETKETILAEMADKSNRSKSEITDKEYEDFKIYYGAYSVEQLPEAIEDWEEEKIKRQGGVTKFEKFLNQYLRWEVKSITYWDTNGKSTTITGEPTPINQ